MKNDYVVYQHKRLDTSEIFYVGIGNKTRPYDFNKRNNWWKKIKNKTDIEVEVLFENCTLEQASNFEILLIKLYGRKQLNNGSLVNMSDGGEKNAIGAIRSDEHKEAIRRSNSTRIVSKETREKMSKIHKGKTVFFSKEHKEKLVLNNPNSLVVLDLETGIFYNSIKEVSILLGYYYPTLRIWLTEYPNRNKTSLIVV